jgi:hypothetical protein
MVRPSPVAAVRGRNNGAGREPTAKQMLALDAYFLNPNAAAVARQLGVSERNVRRIVGKFSDHLRARRQQRDAERQGRAEARKAKIDEWVDDGLDEALRRVDVISTGENETAALRALKLKIDLALRKVEPASSFFADPELDAMRRAKEHELAQQLRTLDAAGVTGPNGVV